MRRATLSFALALAACGGAKPAPPEPVVTVAAPTVACPPGTIYNGVGCATPLSESPKDAGAPLVANDDLPAGPAVSADDARDPRKLARTPRSSALVSQEVVLLERLLGAMSANAADRPAVLQRIGDGWFELSYAEAAQGKTGPAREARKKAIGAYDTFLRDHPNAAHGDDVAYFLGYAYELLGEMSSARKAYYVLIQRYPSSQWIGHAYYAFGDLFLREAHGDPSKADLAVQAFKEVLKFPTTTARPWALLGLGEAHNLAARPVEAQAAFQRLRTEYPAHPATTKIP